MGVAVVALGGNALQPPGEPLSVDGLLRGLAAATPALVRLARRHQLVLTHGNGPQVGALLERQPRLGVAPAVAESQGLLGSLIAQALSPHLATPIACVVTHAVVDKRDPAFESPAKPIGPTLTEAQAERSRAAGAIVAETDGKLRRVVASPRPTGIVEEAAIRALVERGVCVVAAGGGGIPVARDGPVLRPVDCVIDKDWASALLARGVGAEALYLLTGVPFVQLDRGTPRQRDVVELRVPEARRHLEAGQFPAGSMGPKVGAALEFMERNPRGTAVIGSLERAPEGTRILP